jgi:hypothetical protein
LDNEASYNYYVAWYEKNIGDDPMTYQEWEDEMFNIGMDRVRSGE